MAESKQLSMLPSSRFQVGEDARNSAIGEADLIVKRATRLSAGIGEDFFEDRDPADDHDEDATDQTREKHDLNGSHCH